MNWAIFLLGLLNGVFLAVPCVILRDNWKVPEAWYLSAMWTSWVGLCNLDGLYKIHRDFPVAKTGKLEERS